MTEGEIEKERNENAARHHLLISRFMFQAAVSRSAKERARGRRRLRCGRNGDERRRLSLSFRLTNVYETNSKRVAKSVGRSRVRSRNCVTAPRRIRRERSEAGENRGNLPGNRRPVLVQVRETSRPLPTSLSPPVNYFSL